MELNKELNNFNSRRKDVNIYREKCVDSLEIKKNYMN